jgi:hypothetical protein
MISTTGYPSFVVFAVCAIGALLNNCANTSSPRPQATTLQQAGPKVNGSDSAVDLDEYSVYSVVLADERYTEAHTRQLVIKNHTSTGFTVEGLQHSVPSLSRVTIDDYESKNRSTSSIKAELRLKVRYKLISDEEIDNIFRKGGAGWTEFHAKFPGSKGLVTLSRVGFNPDRTEALVHVSIGCDWNCGDSQLVFLRKDKDQWKVEARVVTSVS